MVALLFAMAEFERVVLVVAGVDGLGIDCGERIAWETYFQSRMVFLFYVGSYSLSVDLFACVSAIMAGLFKQCSDACIEVVSEACSDHAKT